MNNTKRINLFENVKIHKAVLTLSIPTIMSSLVMVLYNLADTYFVGMINNPIQNAAVALGAPVLLALNAVNNLFGVGSSSMMSRALGRRDYTAVYKSSAFGFYCSLIFGIIFSILFTTFNEPLLNLIGTSGDTYSATADYLKWTIGLGATPAILNVVMAYMVRSEGSTLNASIGTMSGCFLNIILDPIFILPQGLNMGAAGAGLATFISNCVACVYFFVYLFIVRKSTNIRISPRMFSLDRRIMAGIFAVGVPASIQNLLNVTGMTVLNNFAASYGSEVMAAIGISYKIYMVPMYIATGLSQGIMPLISYNFASGNSKRMKEATTFTLKASVFFMISVLLLYYFGSEFIVRLFIQNDVVVQYSQSFLKGMCLGLPFLCTDFIAVGVFQACGMGKKAFLFALSRKVFLEIPAIYILNIMFPIYGLAYAQFVAELVLAIISVFVLWKIFTNLDNNKSTIHQDN